MPELPVRPGIVGIVATTLACALVLLLCYGEYTRKITVRGYVISTSPNVRLYPKSAGIVTAVFGRAGDRVSAGDPLFEVSHSGSLSRHGSRADELLGAIAEELAAIDAQGSARRRLHEARMAKLRAENQTSIQRRRRLRERLAVAQRRLRLTAAQHERMRTTAANGFVPATELERSQRNLLGDEDALTRINQEIDATESALRLNASETSQLERAHELDQSVLNRERRQMETRLLDMRERRAQVVRAPVDGRITAVTLGPGQRSVPGRPVLSIVPAATEFQVRLLLPSRVLGFVADGSPVNLRYEAFPYQKYGIQRGHILDIADNYLLAHEIEAPIVIRDAVFPATVALEQQIVSFQDRQLTLNNGMLVDADVLIDRRRLIEWLFEPLISLVRSR